MTDNRAITNRQNAQKPRIRLNLRMAIEMMVYFGLNREEAAAEAGMSQHGLYQALRRPHVKKLRNQTFREFRDGAPMGAYARMVGLAEHSSSERIRLKAWTWIAGVDGLAPVKTPVRIGASGIGTWLGYDYAALSEQD